MGSDVVAAAIAVCLAAAGPAAARPSDDTAAAGPSTAPLAVPPSLDRAPEGYDWTGLEVSRIAGRVPKIRAERAGRRDTYARPFLKGLRRDRHWQVSFYAPYEDRAAPNEQIAQAVIDDRTGRVVEAWTGPQVEWTMARGYAGAFGRAVNAPVVWIGLCVLFALPFARPPLRLLHLDIAVLLAFSISYAFFGAGAIDVSVPLVYPLLLYLLGRMIGTALARSRGWSPETRRPLRLAVPYRFLVVGLAFLITFRIGLNLSASNVIDVGYSGVIGADRISHGELPYGNFPAENARGDTYGPVAYYAYVPFEAALPWSGRWDDLPSAHAAAVAFDLVCIGLMALVGRRVRGPALGILLAYAWAAFPFTLLVSASNANDGLVAALVLLVLLTVAWPARRGAALALAGLSKFAPLALGPLVVVYRGGARAGQWSAGRPLAPAAAITVGTALVGGAVVLGQVLVEGRLALFLDRTLGFQRERDSPFSAWGLYGLGGAQAVVQAAALAFALLAAVVPRRRDVVVLAGLAAAVLILLQLSLSHWFYLYIVWFFPLVMVALLAPHAEPEPSPRWL